MPTPSKFSKTYLKHLIVEMQGNIAAAARELDCEYQALWEYINRHPELKDARAIAANRFVDVAQDELFKKVLTGDLRAVELVMRYYGKYAGLGERMELTGVDGEEMLKLHLDARIMAALIAKGETAESILAGLIEQANEALIDGDLAGDSS